MKGGENMTYRTCKLCIERGLYDRKEDMQTKLDVFWLGGRVTESEYQELTTMLDAK